MFLIILLMFYKPEQNHWEYP